MINIKNVEKKPNELKKSHAKILVLKYIISISLKLLMFTTLHQFRLKKVIKTYQRDINNQL